ncbi:MAG: hypothetical protein WCO63_08195 [Bacteroidota bacterium]
MQYRTHILVNLLIAVFLTIQLTSCIDKKEASRELITEGIKEMEKGQSQAAKTFFDEAIRKDPTNPIAYYYRGSMSYDINSKSPQAALDDLTMAIKLDSAYADAYATRAQIKFYMNDKDGACKDWRIAEKLGKPNMSDKTRYCP